MPSFCRKNLGLTIVSILCAAILFTSCAAGKRVKYFQDIPDSLQSPAVVQVAAFSEPKIASGDVLTISVQTIEQKEVAKMGQGNTAGSNAEDMAGYKVDANGEVDVPLVGSVKVAGLTTNEAKDALKDKAKKFYVDPIVNVKFANHYVNVFGEVTRTGRIPLPSEKVSIIDALTLAGDLTIQGKRENILLMRDEDGKKVCVRFNLNSSNIFQSPYFYVKSGDYIYVEPNKAKARSATTDVSRDRYITYVSSFVSLAALLFTIINASNKSK